jgi:hypothetical protein
VLNPEPSRLRIRSLAMPTPHQPRRQPAQAQVIDFDDILLESCSAELRADLLTEAAMLAQIFAPEGRGEELTAMAQALSSGARDDVMGRSRALKLAAALRRLARDDAG